MKLTYKVNEVWETYLAVPGFDVESIPDKIALVIAGNGTFVFRRNCLGVSLSPLKTVNGLEELMAETVFEAQRIPEELLNQIAAFFKDIYDCYKSEAIVVLYYNEETGEWYASPPRQKGRGLTVKYDTIPEPKVGFKKAGTAHSHAHISAFHSGTDDDDEEFFDGVHITIGNLGDDTYSYAYSIVSQGTRTKVEREDVIDCVEATYPVQWLDAFEEDDPVVIKTEESGNSEYDWTSFNFGRNESEKEKQERRDEEHRREASYLKYLTNKYK